MSNYPPEHCPYCGSALDVVESPTIFHCPDCDDYVFHNPCPGGSVAVVEGDRLLLVEDFRDPGEWKLPAGRIECGESPREGVARELREETGLAVDPADLTYFFDSAGEPGEGIHMVNIDYAAPRSATSGRLEAGDDAIDARFWTPAEFDDSDQTLKDTHVDRFGSDDLEWVLGLAKAALDGPAA